MAKAKSTKNRIKKIEKLTSQQQIKEWKKCHDDPLYFINNYVQIKAGQEGRKFFNTYEFQDDIINLINENKDTIILKSRQMGISTILSSYALWLALFNDDKLILIVSNKLKAAQSLLRKIKYAYRFLPDFLRERATVNNTSTFSFQNDSEIIASAASEDTARGEGASLLIFDEVAMLNYGLVTQMWASIYPTLATGGRAVLLSTPKGSGKNFFYEKWKGCNLENNENNFVGYKLMWYMHPDRDEKWRNDQTKQLGKKIAMQENDCVFLSDGDAIVDALFLKELIEDLPPFEIDESSYLYNQIRYFKRPEEGGVYAMGVDTARGDGSDSSAISVFDTETLEQVCEFNAQCSTNDLYKIVAYIGEYYNFALAVVENNGLGWATIQGLIDIEYPNLYYTIKDMPVYDVKLILAQGWDNVSNDKKTPGFSTTGETRPNVLNYFIKSLENGDIKINGIRTLNELKDFVWKRGRYDHADGAHDDLIFASAIVLYVLKTWGFILKEAIKITRAQLGAFKKGTPDGLFGENDIDVSNLKSTDLDNFFNF